MKIIVQHNNCKFINNLDSLASKHQIYNIDINNDIYKIDQKINPDIYIFTTSKIKYEEAHFCKHTSKTVVLYNDTTEAIESKSTNIIVINKSEIPHLYNPIRYKNLNKIKTIEISYFLDNDNEIPKDLDNILYPQTKQKIQMFNNPNIKHVQNMGTLSEDDKADILNETSTFISNNMFYAAEAYLCGCDVVDFNMKKIDVDIDKFQTYLQFFESIL